MEDYNKQELSLELSSLAETLLEEFNAKEGQDLEIFEEYTQALRIKIHLHEKDFCKKFVMGYEVLLKELDP